MSKNTGSRAVEPSPELETEEERLERLVKERTEELFGQVQILQALDYPIVRIYPDNRMEFINNAFFEHAEVPEFGKSKLPNPDEFRRIYSGRTILTYLLPSDHERFEALKREAEKIRLDLEATKSMRFRIGVSEEFIFVSHTGRRTPMQLSVTYSLKYDKYQLSFADITALKQAQEDLEKAHDELERRVQERTAELEKANEEIRQQTHAIMELSTPVIRLWTGIVLMPLIGVIDTQRAAQIEEHLLNAISETQSEVAILDITGVSIIDTSVARHLLKTVGSARMLGATVILTGFSPENAQTIIRLGIDFTSLRTRGSLQAGIAEAFALTNKQIISRS